MSNIKFEYQKEEDGYWTECSFCECEAPVYMFDPNWPNKAEKEPLCEICSCTLISRMRAASPDGMDREYICKIIAQVGNVLLDKLTDRRKVIEK